MLSKLPRWVEIGGFMLAFLAGSVNVIGLLGFSHQAVSHLSGTVSLFAVELAAADWGRALQLLFILLSFLTGAAMSGLFIENASLQLRRRYGFALCIEALLLWVAMLALQNGSSLGHYLASMACGLQNAMVSTYSGAIVRTTHVTGLFTDLGIMIGGRLRGAEFDRRKAILFLILVLGFASGGVAGAITFREYLFTALMLPVGIALLLALTYWGYLYALGRRRSHAP